MMPMRLSQVTLNWVLGAMIGLISPLAHAADPVVLRDVPSTQLPAMTPDGDLSTFRTALRRQVEFCEKNSTQAVLLFGSRKMSRKDWCLKTGRAFLRLAEEAPDFAT